MYTYYILPSNQPDNRTSHSRILHSIPFRIQAVYVLRLSQVRRSPFVLSSVILSNLDQDRLPYAADIRQEVAGAAAKLQRGLLVGAAVDYSDVEMTSEAVLMVLNH